MLTLDKNGSLHWAIGGNVLCPGLSSTHSSCSI